ncbi:MAG: UbiA family prenyltransferase [Betaproteobacteria bacterium]|nr:UbiA family prenyltransferase [Betaproteobacteria bacterium]
MKLRSALALGRVSNLPTVWSNALAGAVLAGAAAFGAQFAVMLVAFSLFYTGGMFLNDAFDAPWDAKQRPERPIPAGEASRRAVFGWGFGMMALGVALLAWIGVAPALAGAALAATITYYDWHHKGNVFSPVVMGLCRVLVYVSAGLCITRALPEALWIGAALMLCYLIGLTYIAKQENLGRVENLWPLAFLAAPVAYGAWLALAQPVVGLFWLFFAGWMLVALWYLRRRRKGDIPRAVVSLIAGISLLDALLIAGTGALALAVVALAGFGVTLFFQRYVAGT